MTFGQCTNLFTLQDEVVLVAGGRQEALIRDTED
jgi:hypothetical protein